jgi:hypothetical protein
MINGIAAATAPNLVTPTQQAAQPTAQQTARFESQLQSPAVADAFAHYDAPLAAPTGIAGDFRSLLDFAGHLSDEFRTKLERSAEHIDSQRWPELQFLADASREMRSLNLTTVQFQFVAAGVEITNRNAQMLFQQA